MAVSLVVNSDVLRSPKFFKVPPPETFPPWIMTEPLSTIPSGFIINLPPLLIYISFAFKVPSTISSPFSAIFTVSVFCFFPPFIVYVVLRLSNLGVTAIWN